jgi:hypothetical protein
LPSKIIHEQASHQHGDVEDAYVRRGLEAHQSNWHNMTHKKPEGHIATYAYGRGVIYYALLAGGFCNWVVEEVA